ncbi:SGNH/GDSL hydrolase family protein [Methylocaldum sp.]|uniref:SGNH/GDSL hydrolase family protein n=1 Tax=Methylocaldum sp. TaxID=1969727 RepID=UPI002D25FB84|nr:SGNH/GDSL hydrolase family protein [Methylocaldum sp.]HYE37283.1 SGNH/GDSL hydrolase family protein [Methylocaldum sp.]
MRTHSLFTSGTLLTAFLEVGSALALEPGQSDPKRLFSMGDSMTRAFNANIPLDNPNLSWVNGYHGFWEDLFDLPDVESHNQRIDANFGDSDRNNQTAAENGATMGNLTAQASGTAGRNVTYATVLLGANDVCKDSIADLPTDEQFRTRFEGGLDTLLANLAAGATVQVVAIPNIAAVYNQGRDKRALGLVDCPDVWARTGNCGSVLSPQATDADRAFALSRIMAYNQILQEVTGSKAAQNPDKFISFTDVSFTYPFTQSELSNLDCFHSSWEGQKILSRETWNNGPFKEHQEPD